MTFRGIAAVAQAVLVLWACSDGGGPSPPPALVFDLQRNAHRDIYRARIDGADTIRLTSDTSDDRQPTSAAGIIVFVSSRDGNGELYSMSASGGPATRLTFTAANEADPALSPDGTKLAYTRDDGGLPRLWIANANGSGTFRATDSLDFAGAVDASPSWGPGSDRVVFVSTTSGAARLYVLTLSDLAIAPILPDTAPDVEPAWSPDGKRIAFASGAGGGARLALLDLTGHGVTFLTPDSSQNGEPSWLPDGRLVFLAEGATPALMLMDPAAPATLYPIPVGSGTPAHPSALRP